MKILVATDGSRSAQAAIRFGAKLAASCRKADLIILTVSTLATDLRLLFPADVRSLVPRRELARIERSALRRRLNEAVRGIRKGSMKVRTHLLDPKIPVNLADAILREADRERADLIVVGSSGRGGFLNWVLGSVAQHLVTHAHRPVAIVRPSRAQGKRKAAA